ncbi:MAG: TylF/MycF/NovP-related O-methyltransferase [Dehalococcoidia bacterium]|jgi:O-methyltransferase
MTKLEATIRRPARAARGYVRKLRAAYRNSDSLGECIRLVRLFNKVRPFTIVSWARLGALYKLSRELERRGIAGDIVECGTCNGGSAAVMGYASEGSPATRRMWLFDSFEGLPQPTDEDGEEARGREGAYAGTVGNVRRVLAALRIRDNRVQIVKGWFQETLAAAPVKRIGLLHIDADLYLSVKQCLDEFYDRVEPGGFIVLDDYGNWEGCRKAVEEFFLVRGLDVVLVQVDNEGRYFEKPQLDSTASLGAPERDVRHRGEATGMSRSEPVAAYRAETAKERISDRT